MTHRPRGLIGRVLFFAGGFLLAGAAAALAYWAVIMLYGTGNYALAQANSLSAPTSATATEASSTSVTISWTPPGSQLPGAQYEVIRNPGGGQVIVCTVSAPTCTDSGLSPGTTYQYAVMADLDNWQSSTATTSFTALGVTTSSLPNGTVGVSYTTTLTATGGSGSYTHWALTSGTLPSWASLNTSTGAITGIPNAAVTTSGLKFTVTDSKTFTATSGSLSLTVNKGGTTTTLNSPSASSVAYGNESSVTFTATVSPSSGPTGTISVANGVTPLCTITLPATTCSISNTNAGNVTLLGSATPYTITATYSGDSNYTGSTSSTQYLTINPGASSTSLGVSPSSVTYGAEGTETFTATVTGVPAGATPTGTAAIKNGSTTLCTTGSLSGSGNTASATCLLTSVQLLGGSYTLTAVYVGDSNYATSTSSGQSLTITKATPTTAVSLSSSSITYGNETTETFTATVTGPSGGVAPTGTVTVYQGSTSLCTTSSLSASSNVGSGSCPLTATKIAAGSYSGSTGITATYNPGSDPNYLTSTSSPAQSLTVSKDSTTTTVSESPTSVVYGSESGVTFTAGVTSHFGEAIPSGDTITVSNGVTTLCTITLPATTCNTTATALVVSGAPYTVTATYNGDTNLSTSTQNASTGLTVTKYTPTNVVTNSPSSPTLGNSVTFTATITGPSGGTTPSGTVTWTLTGPVTSCSSNTGPTGSSNVATYTCVITASGAGTYSATAAYPGGGNYNSVTSSADSFTVAGFVQAKYDAYVAGSNPNTDTISISTTAGDLIVVSVSEYDTCPTVSDSAGNTYTPTTKTPGSQCDGIFYVLNAASVTSVSIKTTQANADVAVTIAEFAGYTSVDEDSANSGTSGNFSVGPTTTTQNANDLLVGTVGSNGGPFTITSTGYTATTYKSDSQAHEELAYQQVTSKGTYSFAGTGNGSYWGAVIYAFH
jgi:hypothetical protein